MTRNNGMKRKEQRKMMGNSGEQWGTTQLGKADRTVPGVC